MSACWLAGVQTRLQVAERDLGTIKDIVSSCKQTVLVVDESAVIFSRSGFGHAKP